MTAIRRRCLVLGALVLCSLAAAPAVAEARTVWLCRPGLEDNPCMRSLTATVVAPDAELTPLRVERTPLRRRPPVDCFYVYPTVSGQPTVNANRRIDPEIRAIASFQANRFSQACRVFAPVYRQLTLVGIADPVTALEGRRLAYRDVRAAWREYLRRYNRGRGVVLVSHSQGTFMLRQLLDRVIEERRAQRRRLVSALLIGGNVTVRRGRDVGGDFERVRACRRPRQTRCVVGYSVFNETPPENAVFGRAGDEDLEVLCNNPASLRGGRAQLHGYVRTEPFPGLLGVLTVLQAGELPPLRTPWISAPGHYEGRCVRADGAHVLQVDEIGDARSLNATPDASWGLHLTDVNIALGNLTRLVRRQSRAYLR